MTQQPLIYWHTRMIPDRAAFSLIRSALRNDPRTAHVGEVVFEIRRPTVCDPEGTIEIRSNPLRRMIDPSVVAEIIQWATN
jgi:hypothetical protein